MVGSEPQQPEQQKIPDVEQYPTLLQTNQLGEYSANNQPKTSKISVISSVIKQPRHYFREFRIHFLLSIHKSLLYARQNFSPKSIRRNLNLAAANVLKFYYKHRLASRLTAGFMALLIVFSTGAEIYNWRNNSVKYELSPQAEQLLGRTNPTYADKLNFEADKQQYSYNAGYTAAQAEGVAGQVSGPQFSGTFPADPTKSVSITDSVNSVDLKLTPNFKIDQPIKKENRLIYPIHGMDAAKIYTLKGGSVKEDFVIEKFVQNELEFSYKIELSQGTEARSEQDGSIGIYGVDSILLGNVKAGTEKDQELLTKARENGKKTKLLFTIPAPFIIDVTHKTAQARAWFSLQDNIVTLHASGLDTPKYPITIDPSVYIESAQQLMKGNSETNVDYDVDNSLIQKGKTTGARINNWATTGTLASNTWDQGVTAAGGYVYTVGGQAVTSNNRKVITSTSNTSFVVPTGVTTITVKAWGAGGGGGAGSGSTGTGGNGGAGGYAKADLTVTPGETLSMVVGAGGKAGVASSAAGNGGGYSAIKRSATVLVQAGGGGGGGAGYSTANGGAGGAGGGASGTAGSAGSGTATVGGGGGAGTNAAGGTAGAAGTGGASGSAGAANAGGDAGGSGAACNTSVSGSRGGAGAAGEGGEGGNLAGCIGGGGGGGGRFGGGGGGSGTNAAARGAGGGGGGSDLVTGANTVETAGSGTTPGNSADVDRNGAGEAGLGGVSAYANTDGEDGIIIITYSGAATSATSQSVSWAHFNTSTNAIESPNPGAGVCSGWCTGTGGSDTNYSLPAARKGFPLVAYNGFLYAMGGSDGTNRSSTVYIAKLGANGEPQKWHPTGGTPDWWYADSLNGATARSYFSAVAYNNRMYVIGGQTNASSGGTNTVEYANINPNGTLGTWTVATGSQLLPYVLHSFSAQSYNDTLYIIGGNSNGTLKNTVYYARLNSDGSLNNWVQTKSFTTARTTMGGSYTALWGAYLYLGGGCTAVNGSGYCTASTKDVQLASINADGSLAMWNQIMNISNDMFSYNMLAWQGGLYRLGGCMSQDASTGTCNGVLANIDFGVVNPDGDASTVSNSEPAGTAPCNGVDTYNCDLPPAGDNAGQGGQMSSQVVINNGYIYNIGGCTDISATNECSTGTAMSGNTSYAALSSSGTIVAPATCGGTQVANSSWCVDSTNRINGTAGVGTGAATVFNNVIYVIGGTNGSGTFTSNIYYNPVNADGSLGAWITAGTGTTGLPGTFTSMTSAGIGYGYAFARANPSSAGSTPGNLYYLGGCNSGGTAGIGCTAYTPDTYKCNIGTSGAVTGCTKTGQLQVDADPDIAAGNQGLGLMAGAIYANYLYLVGGSCTAIGAASDPCGSTYAANRQNTIFAEIDNNNNIVPATGTNWTLATGVMNPVRRRAVSFGYNGYIYSLAGYSGSASLQDLLFSKIDVSTGDITSFSSSGVVVTPRWDLRAIVSNGYVYAIGGCGTGAAPQGCTAMQPQIQTFQLYNNDSGAFDSFTASAGNFTSNTDRWGASSVVYNGYIYVAGGCISATDCTTATNSVQYAQINAGDGTIGAWNAGGNLPANRTWGQLLAAGGSLYYVGGQDDVATNEQSSVFYTTSISSGNPTWAGTAATKGIGDTGSGGQARTKFGGAVWNNRIYVVAGLDSSAAATNTVYISPQQNSGGDITANWVVGRPVNVSRSGPAVTAYANNLYVFGGVDGSGNYLNDSQFAQIGGQYDGTIQQSGTTTITGTGTGWVNSDNGSTIIYSDGSSATVTYSSATSLTSSVSKTVAAGSTYRLVLPNGAIGGWYYSTPLPGKVSQGSAVGANGYMYILGGRSATSSCSPNVLVSPISANTTIASGNKPTGIGDWYETNVKFAGGRYGAAVSYNQGKFYTIGGGCTSPIGSNYTTGTISQTTNTVTGAGGTSWTDNYIGGTITYQDASTATITGVVNATTLKVNVSKTVTAGSTYSISVPRHSYGIVKSQPQVAKYSRMIDTDTDVFPTKWLMNGIDNSIGAQWQMRYRSMTNNITSCASPAMTTWGQETDYGNVTLGTPGTYTPKDGSGANTNCARYFYMSVSIDSSQAFGFPEDVSRGPTITDLSLFFTADPSKRMRHGKTFTGGELQPLDTPF